MARVLIDPTRAVWRPNSGNVGGQYNPPDGVTVDFGPVYRKEAEGSCIPVYQGLAYNAPCPLVLVTALAPTFTRWRVGEYVTAIPAKDGTGGGAVSLASQWGITAAPGAVSELIPFLWAFWVPATLSPDDPRVLANGGGNVNPPPPGNVPPPRSGLDLASLLYLSQQQQMANQEAARQRRAEERADRLAELEYQERRQALRERRRNRR